MNDYNIVFSVPVHEKWDVVLDLVINYMHFNPECAIVLHVSKDFNESESIMKREEFESAIHQIGNVFINPVSLRTGFADIIQAHISNFKYLCSISEFHFFAMCASNELFVKKGLYEHIEDYDCGVDIFFPEDRPIWRVGHFAKEDKDLKSMLVEMGGDGIVASHIEGTFYTRKIFQSIVAIIEKCYDYNTMEVPYPREEIYFSTVLWNMAQQNKSIKVLNPGIFTLVNWKIRYNRMTISIDDVKRSQNVESFFYSVKRVDRNINDYIRAYIRQVSGYEQVEKTFIHFNHYNKVLLYLFDYCQKIKLIVKRIRFLANKKKNRAIVNLRDKNKKF